jgi:predicted P-loop ATPase
VGELARRVKTDNHFWEDDFHKWMLSMVAQWLGKNRQHGNSIVPLLISKQGYNKSTFCKSLIPTDMQWGYNDSLVLSERKSVLQAMSQFLLINLDEFNQISPKVQEGFLKNLVQLASVKVKRPYGKHVEEFPRLASFIATANVTDILSDPSGSRRFIGIELTGPIDVSQPINYDQLYAQAVALIDQNEPYWMDDKQTMEVMESNRQFKLRSPEEMFFEECFRIPEHEGEGQYMTTAAIFAAVKKKGGSAIRTGNIRIFGQFLSNIGKIKRRRTHFGTEYLVIPCQKR